MLPSLGCGIGPDPGSREQLHLGTDDRPLGHDRTGQMSRSPTRAPVATTLSDHHGVSRDHDVGHQDRPDTVAPGPTTHPRATTVPASTVASGAT